jgi:hypothetical protein
LEDEPIYQSNTKEIDQMLDIVNNVMDENLDTSLEDDEKKKSRDI